MSVNVSLIIKCSTACLSFISNALGEDPFDNAATNELRLAEQHLRMAVQFTNMDELKLALVHLEVASSLVSSTSFFHGFLLSYSPKSKKILFYNDLCYQIANIHSILNLDYSMVLSWAEETVLDTGYFPSDFSRILKPRDYENFVSQARQNIGGGGDFHVGDFIS